jgi:hypothetical protein
MWPNENSRLSGCFRDDVRGYEHLAIDLSGDKKIVACEAGTVVVSLYDETWGNTILIRHDDLQVDGGYLYTEYAHLRQRLVEKGETVTRGMQIGIMGKTGKDIQHVHLHLMVKVSSRSDYDSLYKDCCVDPAIYLTPPSHLEKGFGEESTCCKAYYDNLISSEEQGGMVKISNETVTALSYYVQNTPLKNAYTGRITTDARVTIGSKTRSRWITYVRAQILDASGIPVYSDTRYPNADEFDLSALSLGDAVTALQPGAYTIVIYARDEAGYADTLIHHALTIAPPESESKNHETGSDPLSTEELSNLDLLAGMVAVLPACTSPAALSKAQYLRILSVNYWQQGLALAGISGGKTSACLDAVTAAAFLKSVLGSYPGSLKEEFQDSQTGITCKGGVYTIPYREYALRPYRLDTTFLRGGAVKVGYLLLSAKEEGSVPSATRRKNPDLVFTVSRGGDYFGFTVLSIESNTNANS